MPRGGKRNGAGRPRGGKNTRSKEIADRLAADGITPLEVMLQAMRRCHAQEEFHEASRIAKDAAPYIHPRLAAIEHSGPDGAAIPVQVIHDSGE